MSKRKYERMCKLRHGDIAGSVNSRKYRVAYRRFLRYSCRDDRRLPIIPPNWQSDRVQVRPVCRWVGSAKWERNREIKEPTGGRGSSLGGIIKRVSWVATAVNPRPGAYGTLPREACKFHQVVSRALSSSFHFAEEKIIPCPSQSRHISVRFNLR